MSCIEQLQILNVIDWSHGQGRQTWRGLAVVRTRTLSMACSVKGFLQPESNVY